MCQPIRCRICGKTTWTGCGSHIEVRRTVPPADWCPGHAKQSCETDSSPDRGTTDTRRRRDQRR